MADPSPMAALARRRLATQRLTGAPFPSIAAGVAGLLAVQAQDYAGAKWALAQRCEGATESALDAALAAGTIVRTHVMRPTWHLVAAEDLGWLQRLTADRVRPMLRTYDGRLGLDAATIDRGGGVIAEALADGPRTRDELGAALGAAGIPADGQRLAHLVMYAELAGAIASGPLQGKHHTYRLVPPDPAPFDRDEALAQLARRYFTGHGPATVADAAWWSGLTQADVRRGIAACGDALVAEAIEGIAYWHGAEAPPSPGASLHLLPNYDELLIAYKDRGAALDPAVRPRRASHALPVHFVVRDGRLVGGWRRTLAAKQAKVEVQLLAPLAPAEQAALDAAAAAYGRFVGRPAQLVLNQSFTTPSSVVTGT